ncbi:MAG: hypothetical protein V7L01_07550 [Nostoc sp.]|uniref:hypothetical protein n=1 Tax=Nostoc sp. TaxID=1180 RepID=UPI002FFD0459
MQSTLFTELSANEEANLSGGGFFDVLVNKSFNKQTANGGKAFTGKQSNFGFGNANNNSADGGTNVIQ